MQFENPAANRSLQHKLSKLGVFLALISLTQLLVSAVVVMSVPASHATLAASPIYAGAGIALILAAYFLSLSLGRQGKKDAKVLPVVFNTAIFCALALILLLLTWGYLAKISLGALTLTATIALEGPIGIFAAKIYFQKRNSYKI